MREGDAAPRAQATMITSQPHNKQEEEEEEEVELRMPGSFDFGFADPGGAARETPGAGTVGSRLSVCSGTYGSGCR